MFLIPSEQIPDLFDSKVVNEDFEIICKRASSILGISTQKLMNALQQSAEDELQHRFQHAIQKAKKKDTPKQISKIAKTQKIKCSVEDCVVKKITKPQYIDGKIYCASHYKQRNTKQFDTTLIDTIPGSIEGSISTDTNISHFNSLTIDSYKKTPKPILNEEHRSYWSCVPISYVDTKGQEVHYKLHKPTGIIIDKVMRKDGQPVFTLIGHYEDNNFTEKSDIDPVLVDWCKQSGIIV
jgi:hypothetical protein